ncbi:MAG TPA: GDSL-type esterase/lipase family protein [Polyangiaceae bacterium]|nr:GDSL-type esterase/lipase family protein [Polyangiaceae bacterium]
MRRGFRFVALASLTITCARPAPSQMAQPPAARLTQRPPPSTRTPPKPAAASPASTVDNVASSPGALPAAESRPLGHFFDALRALEAHARSQHVRVLWLGDSHTNADFLSGSVRTELQARFGNGGPGFVRIGSKPYRHDGVKLGRDGSWNIDPDPPARRTLQDDGVFGLGGTRAVPASGAAFSLQAIASGADAAAPARFELAYTLPPENTFTVELAGKTTRIDAASACEMTPAGVAHLTLTAPYGSQLSLKAVRGTPRLFNAVVERAEPPGVVLDAAGIDGARLETPLAWNEAAFVAEVARRAPELLVVAYGTNEAFDAGKVEKYGPQLQSLVARLRQGAPDASCLVLGPTDAPLGEASVPRVAEVGDVLRRAAQDIGCSFVSLQQLMGGEGSFALGMKAKERLAQPDKLHLTPLGYRTLGQALAARILHAYSAPGDLAL